MIIKRLHELKKKELLAYGVWLRGEIKPENPGLGSTWACAKEQRSHFWGDEYLAKIYSHPDEGMPVVRVALGKGKPVATLWIARGSRDRAITLLLVDEAFTLPEQERIADDLALAAIESISTDVWADEGDFVILMKLDVLGEAYATRCGFSRDRPRRISCAQLKKNIEAKRGRIL